MQDSEDNPDPRPTELDLNRLGDLKDGDFVMSESGVWNVYKYRNEYTLLFNEKRYSFSMFDFPDLDSLVTYLKELK